MMNHTSLRKIFKASALPSVILLPDSPTFTVVDANFAFLHLFNKKESQIIGEGIDGAFHEICAYRNENLLNLKESLRKTISSKVPNSVSMQSFTSSNDIQRCKERYSNYVNIPVLTDSGEIEYLIHRFVDVTDSLFHELSDKGFKTLIEEGSEMIGILDEAGCYNFVSSSYEQILKFKPQDLVGTNAFDYLHPDDKNLTFKQYSKIRSNNRVNLSPYRFKDNDGQLAMDGNRNN